MGTQENVNNLLIIRKAEEKDYDAVSALEEMEFGVHRQARPDYFKEPSEYYPAAEYKELLDLPCPIAWLAILEGQIVGLCFGKIEMSSGDQVCQSRKVAFIQDLVTLPEYRGQGIATALLGRTREQAVAEQADSLELCVWNFNEGALRLYERQGMRVQYYRMEEKL